MDFLNVGPAELLVLALIGLLLFGPEDLLKFARTLGSYANQARRAWQEITSTVQMEIMEAEREERPPVERPTVTPTLPDERVVVHPEPEPEAPEPEAPEAEAVEETDGQAESDSS
jgi:Sec-independent protein translocase protein TatA